MDVIIQVLVDGTHIVNIGENQLTIPGNVPDEQRDAEILDFVEANS